MLLRSIWTGLVLRSFTCAATLVHRGSLDTPLMRTQRIGVLSAVLTLAASSIVAVAAATPAGAAVPGQVAITEWMYNPVDERAPSSSR